MHGTLKPLPRLLSRAPEQQILVVCITEFIAHDLLGQPTGRDPIFRLDPKDYKTSTLNVLGNLYGATANLPHPTRCLCIYG